MILPELWKQIESLKLDDIDPERPFSQQLAKENHWTLDEADLAISEYKRFAYISAVSQMDLIPADAVHQVWKLHLTYTRHYWEVFTPLLGTHLHHGPPRHEDGKKLNQDEKYANTLKFYRELFEEEPNPDVWPTLTVFNNSNHQYVRVDKSRYLILEKPTRSLFRSLGRFLGISAFPLSVLGYAMVQTSGPVSGTLSVIGWIIVAAIAIMIAIFGCLVWRMEHKSRENAKFSRKPVSSRY